MGMARRRKALARCVSGDDLTTEQRGIDAIEEKTGGPEPEAENASVREETCSVRVSFQGIVKRDSDRSVGWTRRSVPPGCWAEIDVVAD